MTVIVDKAIKKKNQHQQVLESFFIEVDQPKRTTSEPTKWEGVSLRSSNVEIKHYVLTLLVLALFAYFFLREKVSRVV